MSLVFREHGIEVSLYFMLNQMRFLFWLYSYTYVKFTEAGNCLHFPFHSRPFLGGRGRRICVQHRLEKVSFYSCISGFQDGMMRWGRRYSGGMKEKKNSCFDGCNWYIQSKQETVLAEEGVNPSWVILNVTYLGYFFTHKFDIFSSLYLLLLLLLKEW